MNKPNWSDLFNTILRVLIAIASAITAGNVAGM